MKYSIPAQSTYFRQMVSWSKTIKVFIRLLLYQWDPRQQPEIVS